MIEQNTHAEELTVAVTEVGEAAEETHGASEAGASGGILGSLGISPVLFVSQIINFALVFLVVWHLILKPLTKKLDERKRIIDESLDRAKEIEGKVVMANESYEARLKEARVEADTVIARAHDEAKALADTMKQDTKKEIATLVTQAKEKIQSEKEATIQEIRTETAAIAVAIAEKILGQTLDVKKDEAFIKDMLSKLK